MAGPNSSKFITGDAGTQAEPAGRAAVLFASLNAMVTPSDRAPSLAHNYGMGQ